MGGSMARLGPRARVNGSLGFRVTVEFTSLAYDRFGQFPVFGSENACAVAESDFRS